MSRFKNISLQLNSKFKSLQIYYREKANVKENGVYFYFYYFCVKFRDVAQPGSVLAWGARGRWFESSHPDQKLFSEAGRFFYLQIPSSLEGFGYKKSLIFF